MANASIWTCPVCGNLLTETQKSFICEKRHCFDKAKSGYVNLLPVSRKHAKLPGDNAEMIRARRDFLHQNYYQHLQTAICKAIKTYMPENGILLDAGCGEGYYTKQICETISGECYGVDISKTAADFAARTDKISHYAVGSIFHLPVSDQSCDLLINIFAPYCETEFIRVLKSHAYFIMVIPSTRHLWELKAAVYDHPYENQVKDYPLEGFIFQEKISCEKRILLSHSQDIQNLFQMTPYAYRTGTKERERLQSLQNLEVQTSFEILIYQKER